MYRCNSCEEQFEEPATKDIVAEDYLGISHLFQTQTRMNVSICPVCNSDDIEELMKCAICEEWFNEDELHDTTEYINGGCGWCCEQCMEDAEMIEI